MTKKKKKHNFVNNGKTSERKTTSHEYKGIRKENQVAKNVEKTESKLTFIKNNNQ